MSRVREERHRVAVKAKPRLYRYKDEVERDADSKGAAKIRRRMVAMVRMPAVAVIMLMRVAMPHGRVIASKQVIY